MTAVADGKVALDSWLGAAGVKLSCGNDGAGRVAVCLLRAMSTLRHQDPGTSRGWQRAMAATLIGEHGVIVADFLLAMEMSANGLFNEDESPRRLIARIWLLCHEYDADVVTPKPRLPPTDVGADVVSVDLDDRLR